MTVTSAVGDPPGRPRQHPARILIAGFLLPLAVAGALWLSASATIDLARRHGVPDGPTQAAAVAMLEVVSLTGTLLWLLAPTARLRSEAALATMAASGVSLVAGVSAYGWFGAVAPVALVGTVHLASRAWRENWRPATSTGDVDSEPDSEPEIPEPRPAPNGQPLPADPDDVPELPDFPKPRPAPNNVPHPDEDDSETADEPAPLPEVRGVEPRIVAQAAELLARKPETGRPALRAYTGLTDHKAGLVLAALRPRPLAAVGSEAS